MPGILRGRAQQVDIARGDSDDEVEAFIRTEAMPVTVDPQQQHHERPRRPFVPITPTATSASSYGWAYWLEVLTRV